MVKFTGTLINSDTEMRKAYCDTIIEEAEKNDNIVMINCDLTSSMGLKPFKAKFPERSINVGIEEANGVSMAGGLSVAGMVPFFNSFSVFASRRVYDQIFMSCAYPKLNVKIMGGDAGVSATNNGGTHMPFEDMGILRTMPGFVRALIATTSISLLLKMRRNVSLPILPKPLIATFMVFLLSKYIYM